MWRKRKKLAKAAELLALGQLRFPSASSDEPEPEVEVNEAAAALGLVIANETPLELEEEFALWPECLPTFNFWRRLQTQWLRDAMGGYCSLNYPGVQVCMDIFGIKKKERLQLFLEIQAMECAFLNAVNKK